MALENLTIPHHNNEIEVSSFWQDDNPNTMALICHPHPLQGGSMDHKVVTTVTKSCVNRGMHAVRFNFRGVGKSTGEHDFAKGEIDDAEAVLRWMITAAKEKNKKVSQLWLAGFSFGGYVALQLATRIAQKDDFDISLKKLTLLAPAVVDIEDRKYDMSNIELPKNTHVIYGDADEVIPPAEIAKFARDNRFTQTILPDTGHYFHGRIIDLREMVY